MMEYSAVRLYLKKKIPFEVLVVLLLFLIHDS